MPFKDDFVWGAAAAAYQIEGAASVGGRKPSVWDDFCDRPDAVKQGHSGAVACDHYHRFEEDIALMGEIGLQAYRLSLAWPRILPDGTGAVNEEGLAFYDRLIDTLLANNITPWVTLYHWDFPSKVFQKGGWLNRESADWFAEYTEVVAKRLGDRVTHWMTLNEPQVYIDHGHRNAVHAPGLTLTTREQLLAGHHTLLAHGKAVQVLRASCSKPGRIGIAPVGQATIPATDSPEDYAAAEKVQKSVEFGNHFNNAWWFEPACLGHYPETGLKTYAEHMPEFPDSDFNTIKQPIDFVGLNIYQGGVVKAGADGEPEHVPHAVGHPITCFDWPVTPAALRWGPYWAHKHFGLPVVITENGLASMDWVGLDGRVRDGQRIDFTRQYLLELEKAIADGTEVDGYFHWSIMDNFEWGEGYTKRFELIHVDYQTQARTLKDSARWYRTIIDSNGAKLAESPA